MEAPGILLSVDRPHEVYSPRNMAYTASLSPSIVHMLAKRYEASWADGVSLCHLGWSANGAISARCNQHFPDSSDSSTSTSQVAGITGAHHQTRLIFRWGFTTLAWPCDPPDSTSQSAGITGVFTLQKPSPFSIKSFIMHFQKEEAPCEPKQNL
ncbi:Zinc finger protein [Plecturocebus cupreus]